ncbi:MAG: tetratricopeptide repeat protein [Polyangiaceae bacterium]
MKTLVKVLLRTGLQVSLLSLSAAGLLGCPSTTATTEPASTPSGPVGTGDLSGTPQPGQQWTIPDAGSTQDVGADRAKMNDDALQSYQQGMQAFVTGDLQNARKFFQEATSKDSKAFQAFYSLGVVQERLRDDGALASFKSAYTIVPDYEPAIVAYALLKARKGQTGDADTFLTQKRSELPKSAAVLAALAEVKSLSKDSGSAQKLASEALKLNPDYKPAMVVIARDYYRTRKIDLALYALKAILDGFEPVSINPPRDKNNAEALLLRGLIYKEQNNRSGAIDQFEKAVSRRPDLVEARVQLATFYVQAGNAERALPLVEGALRFDADNLSAHLLLGDCYRLQGKFAEAKQRFDYVVSKDASLPQVHYNLGLLYLFAPSVTGMTPLQQVDAASAELKKYQDLRKKDTVDDSDELLNRAKLKRGEIEAAQAAAAPPPPNPPPTTGGGGSDAKP